MSALLRNEMAIKFDDCVVENEELATNLDVCVIENELLGDVVHMGTVLVIGKVYISLPGSMGCLGVGRSGSGVSNAGVRHYTSGQSWLKYT